MQFLDLIGVQALWSAIKDKFAAKATTLAGYGITDAAAKADFDALNTKFNDFLTSVDATDKAITSFKEIQNFLAGYEDSSDTLKSIIEAAKTAASDGATSATTAANKYTDDRIGDLGTNEPAEDGGEATKKTVKEYVDAQVKTASDATDNALSGVDAINTVLAKQNIKDTPADDAEAARVTFTYAISNTETDQYVLSAISKADIDDIVNGTAE